MRELEKRYEFVRPIWLSRNFGQHAATLAGIACASGEWIVTMDEDGQHDPAYLGTLLDAALDQQRSAGLRRAEQPAAALGFPQLHLARGEEAWSA